MFVTVTHDFIISSLQPPLDYTYLNKHKPNNIYASQEHHHNPYDSLVVYDVEQENHEDDEIHNQQRNRFDFLLNVLEPLLHVEYIHPQQKKVSTHLVLQMIDLSFLCRYLLSKIAENGVKIV